MKRGESQEDEDKCRVLSKKIWLELESIHGEQGKEEEEEEKKEKEKVQENEMMKKRREQSEWFTE